MLYIGALIIIIFGIAFRRERIQAYITIFFMWILFAFSFGNADYYIHLRKFTHYQDLDSQTEWLYNKLMIVFNKIGLDYRAFLILAAIFILGVWFAFAKKHTKNIAIVFSLCLIYPFCLDVTMVRYTLAIAVVYIGFNFLFEKKKTWILKYCVCVFIATMIHLSAIFCLLFILPQIVDTRKLTKIMIVIAIILTAMTGVLTLFIDNITSIKFLNIGTKLSIVLNVSEMKYNFRSVMNYRLKMIVLLGSFLIVCYLIYRWIKRKKIHLKPEVNNQINFLKIVIGMNICVLPLIGLLSFSADLFRIQLSLSLVNYVAFAQYFDIREILGYKREITSLSVTSASVILGGIVLALAGLYFWVLSSQNINTVFRPLFESNILFL